MDSKSNVPIIKAENLEKIVRVAENPVPFSEIVTGLKTHKYFRPSGFKIDRRNGNLAVYCPYRRKRDKTDNEVECGICEKDISPVILAKRLPNGEYCVVTENRFNYFNADITIRLMGDNISVNLGGIDVLLYPSTRHCDIQDMPPEEHEVSFELMGLMEQKLIESGYPNVLIGKNMGHSPNFKPIHSQYHIAGIRLESVDKDSDGHEKIWKRPKTLHEDVKYQRKRQIPFASEVKEDNENNPKPIIRDYGEMVLAIHPNMKRPLEAIIYPKNTKTENLSDLNYSQRISLAKATSDLSYALSVLMPAMDINEQYCYVYHNVGGTLYAEVLPKSQSEGFLEDGFRVFICDSSPAHSSDIYKVFFQKHVPLDWCDREPRSISLIDKIRSEIIVPMDEKHIKEYRD